MARRLPCNTRINTMVIKIKKYNSLMKKIPWYCFYQFWSRLTKLHNHCTTLASVLLGVTSVCPAILQYKSQITLNSFISINTCYFAYKDHFLACFLVLYKILGLNSIATNETDLILLHIFWFFSNIICHNERWWSL